MSLLLNFMKLFREKAVENDYWNRSDEATYEELRALRGEPGPLPDPERYVRHVRGHLPESMRRATMDEDRRYPDSILTRGYKRSHTLSKNGKGKGGWDF